MAALMSSATFWYLMSSAIFWFTASAARSAGIDRKRSGPRVPGSASRRLPESVELGLGPYGAAPLGLERRLMRDRQPGDLGLAGGIEPAQLVLETADLVACPLGLGQCGVGAGAGGRGVRLRVE